MVTPDTTLALDVGTYSIWMNRYFPAGHARQVLVSNGQQTLGVAVPWAMATNLCRPGQPVISVSGDGASCSRRRSWKRPSASAAASCI